MSKVVPRNARWPMVAAVATLLLVAGCGGGSVSSTPAPGPSSMPNPSPTPTPTPTPSSAFLTSEYNRSDGPAQHGAIAAWTKGYNGSGVTIGIVDSGIDSDSPEFAGRIATASRDVAATRGIDNADSDHGTLVAMVAAAARDNTGVMGIAFNATIAMFRADDPGSCATYDPNVPNSGCDFFDDDIAKGINAAVAAGAKVINLSLGGSPPAPVLANAVASATAAGAVVVVSGGNDGDSTDPALDPNNPDPFASGLRAAGNGRVIIAGSVDASNVISAFSNRAGSESAWYLAARGERVCCVYENGVMKVVQNPDGSSSVYVVSGTSFSAPQVAGAAALLFQAFPNLTATQVVDLLLRTARDAGDPGTDAVYGRGILDIAAAFAPQGTTSLAGSTTAITIGSTTAVTSAPMGDATKSPAGLSAIVLDAYGRAYQLDLAAGLRGASVMPRLGPALARETRNLAFGNDGLALAFSIDARDRSAHLPWQGQLRLSSEDATQARVLAGRVASRIAPGTQLGFVYGQGTDGMIAQLRGQPQPAFLIARSPLDDAGLVRVDGLGAALHQRLGDWGLALGVERTSALSAGPVALAADRSARMRLDPAERLSLALDRRWDNGGVALGASWLIEQRTVLGALFNEGFGPGGADSAFLDASGDWRFAPDWRLGAAWRGGVTWARGGGSIAGGSRLLSQAWSLDLSRDGVLGNGDTIGLRLAQPLRVERGGLLLNLPVDYSYATLQPGYALEPLALVPHGRELDAELLWRGSLWNGSGMASVFYRRQPGHFAAMPADAGVALSWTRKF